MYRMFKSKIKVNRQLFDDTTHTPALVDLVGEHQLKRVIDFCFIENPYFPERKVLKKLISKVPDILKCYPSSNPILAQQNLADVINVAPENLVIGNGATVLIGLARIRFLIA